VHVAFVIVCDCFDEYGEVDFVGCGYEYVDVCVWWCVGEYWEIGFVGGFDGVGFVVCELQYRGGWVYEG